MIIDDFISSYGELKKASLSGEFKDEINAVDGVTYPLICKDIPEVVRDEVLQRLALFLGRPIIKPVMFMRKSTLGVACPQQAHADGCMGTYSLMLYTNKHEGGTSLVKHTKTGIAYQPEDPEFIKIIVDSQNDELAWEITEMIHMEQNRGFIFDAKRIHRAEPVGGFGKGKDARVVLTCFFS